MKKLLLFLYAFFVIISSFSQEKKEFDWDKPMLGKKAPALQVKEWLTEKPDTTGKFIILDFWSTGCGPCVKFTPRMNEFSKMFKKEAIFIAIALQSKESVEKESKRLERIIKKRNEKYTPIEFYQATDPKLELFGRYGGESIPMVIIIDPKGIVRWQGNPHGKNGEGALTEKMIKEIIAKYKKK